MTHPAPNSPANPARIVQRHAQRSGSPPVLRHLAVFACLSFFVSCSHLPFPSSDDTAVVYALGTREGFTSPLNGTLKPASPALEFSGSSITLTPLHQRAIQSLADAWQKDHKLRYLVVGYAPPGLPEDHARSLSERRALGVRQRFIELGVEGSSVHTIGLGNDFSPTSPTSHVVVIYQQ